MEDVKEVSKDALKEVSFRIDEAFIQYVKELDIDVYKRQISHGLGLCVM